MRRAMRTWVSAGLIAGLAGCGDLADPPLDNPLENSQLPVPEALRATAGDQQVSLAWNVGDATGVVAYRVFRRASTESGFRSLADVAGRAHVDASVQNGVEYEYAVACLGQGGAVGRRSTPIVVSPDLYSVIIEDGRLETAARGVTLGLAYPAGTAYMQLSNRADLADGSWETARATRAWTLLPDDGDKTVYARFRDGRGVETSPVSDRIELDTVAEIRALEMDVPAVLAAGSIVHLRLTAGETYGRATVRFGTALAGIELRDDGTLGDPTPDDGVFERDLVIDTGMTVLGEPPTGAYVDGAGNVAPEFTGTQLLTLAFYPQAVTLARVDPSGRARLSVQWLASQEGGFQEYRIHRSPDAAVDELDELAATLSNRSTQQWNDSNLQEGRTYHYRVFVRSRNGLQSGSNVVAGTVEDLVPTQPVLHAPTNVGATAMTLRWDASPITDFMRYRLYRSAAPGVSEVTGTLAFSGTLQDLNYYNDYGLAPGTTYYYVLYVDDLGAKTNQSLEIVASTL